MLELNRPSHGRTFDNRAGYRRRARRALEMTKEAHTAYETRPRTGGIVVHQNKGWHEIAQGIDDLRIAADGTILFSALAVESALNFYGVVKLGEPFFQTQFERLGLVPKLSVLIATCNSKLVEDTDAIVKATRRLSSLRNGLAHPKTIELGDDRNALPPRELLGEADEAVRTMEEFFEEFVRIDPSAVWITQIA